MIQILCLWDGFNKKWFKYSKYKRMVCTITEPARVVIMYPITPPQVGAWRSVMHNLRSRNWNWLWPKALVKMSASWCWVGTCAVEMIPEVSFSRAKWQSISMCLVHSWKTGLAAIWRAAWLSQYKRIGWVWKTRRSYKRVFSHIQAHTWEWPWRETVVCFFIFQEIGCCPT